MHWHHPVSAAVVPPPDHQGSQQPSEQRASPEYSLPCSHCLSHIDLNTQTGCLTRAKTAFCAVLCLICPLSLVNIVILCLCPSVLHSAVCVFASHQYPAAVWPQGNLNATRCNAGPYSHCRLSGSLHMAGEWVWSSPLVAGITWRYRPASLSDWRPWTTPGRAPLTPDAEERGRREKTEMCSPSTFFTVWAVEQLSGTAL